MTQKEGATQNKQCANNVPTMCHGTLSNGTLTTLIFIKNHGRLPRGELPHRTIQRAIKYLNSIDAIKKLGYGVWEITDSGIYILENVPSEGGPNLGSRLAPPNGNAPPNPSFPVEILDNHPIRYHGFQYTLRVRPDQDWRALAHAAGLPFKIRKAFNGVEAIRFAFKGFIFDCFLKAINIYPEAGEGYFGPSVKNCKDQVKASLQSAISGLESSGFDLRLDGRLDLRQTKVGDFAELNNELARDSIRKGEQINFKGDDRKTWLKADLSKGRPELEAVHPQKSDEDMEAVKGLFDYVRAHPYVLHELGGMIFEIANQVKACNGQISELASGMTGLVQVIKLQYPEKPKDSETEPFNKDTINYVG